ncbi:MAG: hypothetical protein BKP49_04905 [Treponema sp. CETP13]|nr:MAG: hypothetical protein BKP49_04905 [Treponema sp. CETP13]
MSVFNPKEIMFAATTQCNLNCAHCFVERRDQYLSIPKAKKLIESASSKIERIGFTGGEPFLYIEFIEEITKCAIDYNLMFDRIMTNGVWWNTKKQLYTTLQKIYDAGYDGKFGISFDSFHNQNLEKLLFFFNTVYKIWQDNTAIEIQSVICTNNACKLSTPNKEKEELADSAFLTKLSKFAKALNTTISSNVDKNGIGLITLQNETTFIPVYRFPQSRTSDNPEHWDSKSWFKEDFCTGPGHVLYVHSNGNVAPCCGFANENTALCIGTIDNSFSELIENSHNNKMVQTCYNTGLEAKRIEMQNAGKSFPGITNDICLFCDYLCKHNNKIS